MSVVKLEICSRMPSFCASAVVRSARDLLQLQVGPPDRGRRGARDRVGDPGGVDGEARPGRLDPHARPLDDEPRVLGARAPAVERGLDRLRDPVTAEEDLEAVVGGVEADEPGQPRGRERAHVLALEGERHRGGHERTRLGQSLLGDGRRQPRLDVAERRLERAVAAEDGLLERGHERLAGRSGRRDGRDDPLDRDPGAPRVGQLQLELRQQPADRAGRHEHRVDRQRRRRGIGERTQAGAEGVVAALASGERRGRLVDPEDLARLDVVEVVADADLDRLRERDLADGDARERALPVDGVARGDGRDSGARERLPRSRRR